VAACVNLKINKLPPNAVSPQDTAQNKSANLIKLNQTATISELLQRMRMDKNNSQDKIRPNKSSHSSKSRKKKKAAVIAKAKL